MTNQEILTKAIEKAIAGGWKPDSWVMPDMNEPNDVWQIIFNHDFARALWGEQGFPGEFTGKYPNPIPSNGDTGAQRGWQYHLQQMVIADDPIRYLGENI